MVSVRDYADRNAALDAITTTHKNQVYQAIPDNQIAYNLIKEINVLEDMRALETQAPIRQIFQQRRQLEDFAQDEYQAFAQTSWQIMDKVGVDGAQWTYSFCLNSSNSSLLRVNFTMADIRFSIPTIAANNFRTNYEQWFGFSYG